MTQTMTKDTLFRPAKSKTESKADATTQAARALIDADRNKRAAKTARLREARLQMEADAPPPAEKPVRKTRKAAPKKKA